MGEKDKVLACIKLLESKCQYMEENFSSIQVEVRQTQHKYIERANGTVNMALLWYYVVLKLAHILDLYVLSHDKRLLTPWYLVDSLKSLNVLLKYK